MKKPSLIKSFFSFLLKVVVVLVLMVVIAVASFEGVTYYLTGSLYDLKKEAAAEESTQDVSQGMTQVQQTDYEDMENTLFFLDSEDGSKQYITLNMLNTKTYALDVVLVPLNAQITVSEKLRSEIIKEIPDAKNSVNLTDISRAFGDQKYEMIQSILEDALGITVDRYDVMSEKNFIKFLDMVDPILYTLDHTISYRDEQNVIHSIAGGEQSLDGEQAMELIAYLDGTDGQESDRLERTSTYLESFLDALLQEKSSVIMKKYQSLVQPDSEIEEESGEVTINSLTDDAVTVRILQGSESEGTFSIDSQKAKLQIATLVEQSKEYTSLGSGYGSLEDGEANTQSDSDADLSSVEGSSECSIELYNAAYVSGLAADWENYLEEEGYSISLVDSYQEEGPLSETRIVVTKEGMGEDLLSYFPDAAIEVGEIDTGGDIRIYIGTDSTDVGAASDNSDTQEDSEYGFGDNEEEGDTTVGEDRGDSGGYQFDTDSEF